VFLKGFKHYLMLLQIRVNHFKAKIIFLDLNILKTSACTNIPSDCFKIAILNKKRICQKYMKHIFCEILPVIKLNILFLRIFCLFKFVNYLKSLEQKSLLKTGVQR
jgi:hypothetical protein